MSCERYRKTLAELAAGGVPPLGLEAHLAACAVCRTELLSLQEGLALADDRWTTSPRESAAPPVLVSPGEKEALEQYAAELAANVRDQRAATAAFYHGLLAPRSRSSRPHDAHAAGLRRRPRLPTRRRPARWTPTGHLRFPAVRAIAAL